MDHSYFSDLRALVPPTGTSWPWHWRGIGSLLSCRSDSRARVRGDALSEKQVGSNCWQRRPGWAACPWAQAPGADAEAVLTGCLKHCGALQLGY